jgi:hypothetical protein
MENHALQYFMHDGRTTFRIELSGSLTYQAAQQIREVWRIASSEIADRRLVVDLTFVTHVDDWGRGLIARWHREGVHFVDGSQAARPLAESILGAPLPGPVPGAPSDGTWLPFRKSFLSAIAVLPLLLYSLACPAGANAATLKSETVAAWDAYLRTANAGLQSRVRPGGSFLWTFENPGRAAKVRAGEIVVAPEPGQSPRKIPGGLIHHWMGALFLPGLKLQDVLAITSDYDRYRDFYRPSVVESKTIVRTGVDDRFSMLLMNQTFFLKTALDADYLTRNVRMDARRFYSTSMTTRLQEIEDYGQPDRRSLPEGEGGGYIWKLYSISRLEQRDRGVYVELEAIALSRDIPPALRFFVDPIVRRVSRNSLVLSLQQTEAALRANCVAADAVPARQLGAFPASLITATSSK